MGTFPAYLINRAQTLIVIIAQKKEKKIMPVYGHK